MSEEFSSFVSGLNSPDDALGPSRCTTPSSRASPWPPSVEAQAPTGIKTPAPDAAERITVDKKEDRATPARAAPADPSAEHKKERHSKKVDSAAKPKGASREKPNTVSSEKQNALFCDKPRPGSSDKSKTSSKGKINVSNDKRMAGSGAVTLINGQDGNVFKADKKKIEPQRLDCQKVPAVLPVEDGKPKEQSKKRGKKSNVGFVHVDLPVPDAGNTPNTPVLSSESERRKRRRPNIKRPSELPFLRLRKLSMAPLRIVGLLRPKTSRARKEPTLRELLLEAQVKEQDIINRDTKERERQLLIVIVVALLFMYYAVIATVYYYYELSVPAPATPGNSRVPVDMLRSTVNGTDD
ncbi:hypothetical protein HPB50_028647 [Hyalomma asiaticum]|nr:hypothetical protein HPB50_028647 [Hyalomma asiaticum]